jgi:cis-L-3-hydroxyproline dehydratase
VPLVVACGRDIHASAAGAGLVRELEAFGASFVTDACWCMIGEPIVPPGATTVMTNSGKYANYAPALVGRSVRFAGLKACVDAAVSGRADPEPPPWLRAAGAQEGTSTAAP